MSKYSLECKLKVVKEYLDGKSGGIELIARKYNIPFGTVRNWIDWFNANGIEGLKKKQSNNKYTGEFKLSVTKYRQINNLSYREAAEHLNLPNGAIVASWAKKYEEEGFSGLNKIQGRPRKDMSKKEKNKEIANQSMQRYGYRRIFKILRFKGFVINHKKVLRIMKELNLLCKKFRTKSRKYSSYKGEIGKVANNLINRNFYANKPNKIWLTDVTEFRLSGREEKLYLSPILDIFNGEIISYSISKNPTTGFTNKSLDNALDKFGILNGLVIHSDQGLHYQHTSWSKRLEERGIKQSMSRKGNCLDNSPMENFFGLLKQEMFYGEDFKSYQHLKLEIEEYIR